MDLDPLTADHADRTAREDEEAAAVAGAASLGEGPVLLWTPASRAAMKDGVLRPRVLIFATTPEACALLRPVCDAGELAGSAVLPATSLAGATLPPSPADAACRLHWVDGGGGRTVLATQCAAPVPPERAPAVADALLGAVDAETVVVVGSLPAHIIPGTPPPSTIFTLLSSAAPFAATPPLLPPGVAVGGLPAALFSRRQAAARPAVLLACIDARAGAPAAATLAALAAAAGAVLRAAGAPDGVADAVAVGPAAVAAAVALDAADAVSTRSAVYV